MIVARTEIDAKWGRGDDVVAAFKEMMSTAGEGDPPTRLLTDLSGEYFTVVIETTHESLAAWETWREQMFAKQEFVESFAKTAELINSGRLRFYTIQQEAG